MQIEIVRSYNKDVPSWQSCFDNLNESMINNEQIKHDNFGYFVSHSAHKIKEVKLVLDELKFTIGHLYININAQGEGFGRHKDDDDVFFWQGQGKTLWLFDDGTKYLLELGDLIKVPRQTYHTVISLSARAGISMSR